VNRAINEKILSMIVDSADVQIAMAVISSICLAATSIGISLAIGTATTMLIGWLFFITLMGFSAYAVFCLIAWFLILEEKNK
jgi:hypothetical protein